MKPELFLLLILGRTITAESFFRQHSYCSTVSTGVWCSFKYSFSLYFLHLVMRGQQSVEQSLFFGLETVENGSFVCMRVWERVMPILEESDIHARCLVTECFHLRTKTPHGVTDNLGFIVARVQDHWMVMEMEMRVTGMLLEHATTKTFLYLRKPWGDCRLYPRVSSVYRVHDSKLVRIIHPGQGYHAPLCPRLSENITHVSFVLRQVKISQRQFRDLLRSLK